MDGQDSHFNKIYWLKNFSIEHEDVVTLTQIEATESKLKEYNEKGYNIYQTVNTFIGNKRQISDVAEIRSCFIDIDYSDIVDQEMDDKQRALYLKTKYEKEIQPVIANIKQNHLGVLPSLINITNKGFHLFYDYSKECYFIDFESHKYLNDFLVKQFGGDENAKDLARVCKVVGYYDWKSGKQLKIKTLENSKEFVTLKNLEFFLKKDVSFREPPLLLNLEGEKKDLKKDNISKNIELYESQDPFFIIEKTLILLENKAFFKKYNISDEDIQCFLNRLKYLKNEDFSYSFYESDGKTLTSGLKLELKEDSWKINDYSRKNRRGNYNFLKNWVFKELSEEKGLIFNSILKEVFGFGISKNNKDLLKGDFKTITDLVKGKTVFDVSNVSEENQTVFKKYNKTLLEQIDKFDKSGRIPFIGLIHLINKSPIEYDNENKPCYIINWKDFFDILGLDEKNRDREKAKYKEILAYISGIKFPFTSVINGREGSRFKSILDVWFENEKTTNKWGRGHKDFFAIYPLENIKFIFSENAKFAIIDRKCLQYKTKSTEFKLFLLELDWLFKNTEVKFIKLNLDKVFEKLNLHQEKKENLKILRKHFSKAKEEGILKHFKVDLKQHEIEIASFVLKS